MGVDVGVPVAPTFREELRTLLNKHSIDAKTNVPDFLLAPFIEDVIIDLIHLNRVTAKYKENK